jgi:5-methylcytosine-specific restriction endonuclease McrA
MNNETKVCSTCKTERPITDYFKLATSKDGRYGQCKHCRYAVSKAWHKNNPQYRLEKYKQSRDISIAYVAKYQKEHPDKVLIKNHKARAKKYGCEGTFTFEEWQHLCEKYNHCCLKCGGKEKLTIDHIIPLSGGGRNSIENIQPLCLRCNSSKNALTEDYRGRPRKQPPPREETGQ